MQQVLLFLSLLFLCMVPSCLKATPTPPPPPPPVESRIDVLIDTIYSASGVQKNWEEITETGMGVKTIVNPEKDTYNVSLKDGIVYVKHLETNQVIKISPMEDKDYAIVPLLYNSSKGIGWSGLMLIKCEDGKYYLERSLSAMTDTQLEKVMKELQELYDSIYDQEKLSA